MLCANSLVRPHEEIFGGFYTNVETIRAQCGERVGVRVVDAITGKPTGRELAGMELEVRHAGGWGRWGRGVVEGIGGGKAAP